MDFYAGRVLRLDLTALRASVEPLDPEWARLFVGGKGLLLRHLFEELPPGTDALAPENPLILATGPFAGTLAATCSRLAVGCKSPATGTLLDSYVGGSFAPELKFAGYDVVLITGRAPEPVLVRITDDQVEFVPATGRYWGLETAPLEELIRKEMGPGAKVLSTGPAGENLVPFACLSTDQFHKAGRGGAGAVMGSKNLKAVAVRGTGAVTVGDVGAFTRDVLDLQNERVLEPRQRLDLRGGHAVPRGGRQRRRRPAHAQLAHRGVRRCRLDRFGVAAAHPHEGPRLHAVPAGLPAGASTSSDYVCEGPEFETLGLCGSNCGDRRSRRGRGLQSRVRRGRSRHDVDRLGRRARHGPLRDRRRRLRAALRRDRRVSRGAAADRRA